MTIFSYQGVPSTIAAPTVAVASGGSLTIAKAGTYYFWLQARNLAGVNLPSTAVGVTISEAQIGAGSQRISITIPSTTRPSPNGCCIWEYVIMANTTNDASTACVVATVPGFEVDGTTPITLPATIYLSNDSHLAFNTTVTNTANLPASPVNGMRRYLDDLTNDPPARFVAWNSVVGDWLTVYPQAFNTNLTSITGINGALRDTEDITDERVIQYPSYGLDPDTPHRPVGYWLINNESVPIPAAKRISIAFSIGDENISNVSGIVGGVELRFLGYVNVTTGVLDTSGMTVNVPIAYQGEATGLTLQKDLPVGSAVLFTVQANFSSYELPRKPANGSLLRVYAQFFVEKAAYTPLSFLGSFIDDRFNRRRIVPQNGLSVLALKGTGCIEMAEGGSLCFPPVSAQEVFGLLANTADQICAITVNGTCLFASSIEGIPGAAIRAIAGTTNGVGATTEWSSSTVPLNNTVLLKVSITNPTAIREDYPDVIAGSPSGEFNGVTCRVFIKNNSTGAIAYFDQSIPIGVDSYDITVGDITGATLTTSTPSELAINDLPQPSDPAFGCYKFADDGYSSTIVAGTSTFTSGNYKVAIAIGYTNTVTSISHDPIDGCIAELAGSIPDLFQSVKYWSAPRADLTGLRSLTTEDVEPNQVRMVKDVGGTYEPYVYDSLSTGTDDLGAESEYVRISDVESGDMGRFHAFMRVRRSLILQARSTPPTTRANEIAIFVDADNILRQRAPSNGLITTVGSGGSGGGGIQTADDETELLALSPDPYEWRFLLRSPRVLLYFDPDSTATHNGVTVFRPTTIDAEDPGRWLGVIQPTYDNILTSGGDVVVGEDGNIMTEVI